MAWDLSGDRPIWLQLTEQLTRQIVTGAYPPGSKLPPVRELAAQAGVNPNTMQRALAALEQSGLARADRTAGRLVTDDAGALEGARKEEARRAVQKYLEEMGALGYGRSEAVRLLEEELS